VERAEGNWKVAMLVMKMEYPLMEAEVQLKGKENQI
jgi:hypothetical protein